MKVSIIYRSRTGITENMAEEINALLKEKKVETDPRQVDEIEEQVLDSSDIVFLGCWTSGLFFFLQHPDKVWIENIKKSEALKGKKVVLFTTYKILTGSMFKKMAKVLKNKDPEILLQLKSRDGHLSDDQKKKISAIIEK